MLGMTTTILPYTEHYSLTIMRAKTLNGKESGKTIQANYTTSNLALKSGKVPTTVVGNMRLS